MLLNFSASAVRLAVLLALLSTVPACAPQQAGDRSAATSVAEYRAFGAPQRVTIRGYDGDAMEPFITKDGQYLLCNNRNDPRTNTNLHFAARVDGLFTGGPVPKTADPNSGMTRADWGHPGRRCSREAHDRAGRTSHHGLATGYNT